MKREEQEKERKKMRRWKTSKNTAQYSVNHWTFTAVN